MTRRRVFLARALALGLALVPAVAQAATPGAGTVSSSSSSASWQGGSFLVSNPAACLSSSTLPVPGCDWFDLTVAPLTGPELVDIAITPANPGDDYDLYIYDAAGNQLDSSATGGGNEQVTLSDPPAGTYRVVVQAFLVSPGSTYRGQATQRAVTEDQVAQAYHGTRVTRGFVGTPANQPARSTGAPLVFEMHYVGRNAAEPTLGIRKNGTAFIAAGDFDALPDGSPEQLARTEVLRSRDGGASWQSVQPNLILGDTTEPPTSLDPYIYVDEDTGRLFSIDLYGACSWLLYSDDEGQTWTRNMAACGEMVNDHQTLYSGPPPAGVATQGYPKVLYYCFNRVADSACGRSLDGGKTFLPAGAPAYLGVDPATGGVCGGLTGQLMTDPDGRAFLPKGHCSYPWVSITNDAGLTWGQVQVSDYIQAADTHTAVTADAAGSLYYLWFDARDRLPYLSVSTDHGRTWGVPLMIAPPGVHEVNFPAIVAGDSGRIMITFPGTTSRNRLDQRRPWSSYIVVSINALSSNPLFVWTTGNDPADPIHRGDCGPGRCGGMFDFLDIVLSPWNGRVWASATDTCTGDCVTGDGASEDAAGAVYKQVKGPLLWTTEHFKQK
ncbi:MAG TPA: sialidase family protein [Thermoanaerobaculia bacterium]|nr:sialidase family protein [Thermoanaerobaculia bacterium]